VFFLVPVGRANNQPRLTPEQVEDVFRRLWQESCRRSFSIKTTEAPHYRRFVLQQKKAAGRQPGDHVSRSRPSLATNDGKGIIFVAHNGEIYPSGFMPLAAGVFPRDNLVATYQHSPVFQALRDVEQLEGKCGVCEFRNICGGSRARAYAVTGNPLAAEPDCEYFPAGWPA
jgi:radical SAM protein with 4Fe4S-binding SPASM domain